MAVEIIGTDAPSVSMRLGNDRADRQKDAKQFNEEINQAKQDANSPAPQPKAIGGSPTTQSLVDSGPRQFTDKQIYAETDAASKRIYEERKAEIEANYEKVGSLYRPDHKDDTLIKPDEVAELSKHEGFSKTMTGFDHLKQRSYTYRAGDVINGYTVVSPEWSIVKLNVNGNDYFYKLSSLHKLRTAYNYDDQRKLSEDVYRNSNGVVRVYAQGVKLAALAVGHFGGPLGGYGGQVLDASADQAHRELDCIDARYEGRDCNENINSLARDIPSLPLPSSPSLPTPKSSPVSGTSPTSKSSPPGQTIAGVVSGEINRTLPDSAPPAPSQPTVIVGRSAFDLEPGTAGMRKALGLDSTKTSPVAHASDGHGADFDVVVNNSAAAATHVKPNNSPLSRTPPVSTPLTAREVLSSNTAPLKPGKSDLGQYGIDEYGSYSNRPGDKFAGHEMLQNAWLEAKGYGERLKTDASRKNPAVALSHDEHVAVGREQRKLGLFDQQKLSKMSATEVIEQNALAMKNAGVPDYVIETLKTEALKHTKSLPIKP